jgi:hypothetical protein
MRCSLVLLALGLCLGVGCGGQAPNLTNTDAGLDDQVVKQQPAAGRPARAPAAAKAEEAPAPRKIIYTGKVDLIVDDFDRTEQQLRDLLKEQNGYVAKSEVAGTPGSPRRGSWTVRVPADKFDEFVAALGRLGEARLSSSDSQDITDRYHDTQAAIKNLEASEEGLRKLYNEKVGSMKDLLEVRQEMNKVRTEIDIRKGQIQRWDKEVAFATIVVTFQDRRSYTPPVFPDFGTSIGRTFRDSIEAMLTVGRGLVIGLVAVAPWLLVLAFVALPFWITIRHRRAHRALMKTR